MTNRIRESLIMAVAVIIFGLLITSGINIYCNKDRIVSVRGLAEMEVPADQVIWHLAFHELGNDLPSINTEIKNKNDIIIKFLTDKGISPDEVTLSSPNVVDQEAQSFSEKHSAYRYNVTSVLTVATDKVDLVRRLLSEQAELINQGIALCTGNGPEFSYEGPVTFSYTKLNSIKPQMIEEATKNARIAAEKFAKDSESKLGKIRQANQGQFSISDRDVSTHYIKKVRVVTSIEYMLED